LTSTSSSTLTGPIWPQHADYRSRLERLANDDEPLGIADAVLSGFVRVIADRRFFVEPTPP
jgi:uncharacterized protein